MESERCVEVIVASADSQRRMNKLVLHDSRAGASRELIFNRLMDKEYIQRYTRKRYSKKPLKPITKVNSKLGKDLQEWEVDSTKGRGDLNQ